MSGTRYPGETLTRFTADLLSSAGMEGEKAESVARLLVLTDMLGRHTHGVGGVESARACHIQQPCGGCLPVVAGWHAPDLVCWLPLPR